MEEMKQNVSKDLESLIKLIYPNANDKLRLKELLLEFSEIKGSRHLEFRIQSPTQVSAKTIKVGNLLLRPWDLLALLVIKGVKIFGSIEKREQMLVEVLDFFLKVKDMRVFDLPKSEASVMFAVFKLSQDTPNRIRTSDVYELIDGELKPEEIATGLDNLDRLGCIHIADEDVRIIEEVSYAQ